MVQGNGALRWTLSTWSCWCEGWNDKMIRNDLSIVEVSTLQDVSISATTATWSCWIVAGQSRLSSRPERPDAISVVQGLESDFHCHYWDGTGSILFTIPTPSILSGVLNPYSAKLSGTQFHQTCEDFRRKLIQPDKEDGAAWRERKQNHWMQAFLTYSDIFGDILIPDVVLCCLQLCHLCRIYRLFASTFVEAAFPGPQLENSSTGDWVEGRHRGPGCASDGDFNWRQELKTVEAEDCEVHELPLEENWTLTKELCFDRWYISTWWYCYYHYNHYNTTLPVFEDLWSLFHEQENIDHATEPFVSVWEFTVSTSVSESARSM